MYDSDSNSSPGSKVDGCPSQFNWRGWFYGCFRVI